MQALTAQLAIVVVVSVLFSEPKIPQCVAGACERSEVLSFSALQRAENSSIEFEAKAIAVKYYRFSALQRAENSSITTSAASRTPPQAFQCSSASRKFLNNKTAESGVVPEVFQCSSASRKFLNLQALVAQILALVFQCSSASRKFLNTNGLKMAVAACMSFSALQRAENSSINKTAQSGIQPDAFQCSSASRKFLNGAIFLLDDLEEEFQCSSASRKFLN